MANRYVLDTDYKIGRSAGSMARLRDLGVAVPDQVIFQPASAFYMRADYSRVGDGYATAFWVWDMISLARLSNLLAYLDGGESASVYIYTDLRDGTNALPRNAFATYSCVMWKPLLHGPEGMPVAKSPYVVQTVQLRFINLQVYPSS
jgi:hypothetical protein